MISCPETCSAYKHVLIPSYVISHLTETKYHKTKHWLVGEQTGQDQ